MAAEKSWLARAMAAGVVVLSPISFRIARAVEIKVPGDFFLFFVDALLLCFACVETLCALELLHRSDVFYSSVLQVAIYCNSFVFSNSVSADRSRLAVSRLLAAAAADVIEGSLEVKLPTIWTVGKAEVQRGEEKK